MNASAFDALSQPFHASAKECAALLGAVSFITDTETVTDKNGNVTGISAYINRFRFDLFFMEFVYSPRLTSRVGAPSTLTARIYPDPRERTLSFSPYDLMDVIAPSDFVCRQFSYIENEQRMTDCCLFLARSLQPHMDKIRLLSEDEEALNKAYDGLRQEICSIYRQDIFADSGNGDIYDYEMLQMRIAAVEKWKTSIYASAEYNEFLTGNNGAVAALPARYRTLPVYMRRLSAAAMANQGHPYPAVTGEAASLSAMVARRKKTATLPILLLTCLIAFPVFALLFGGLYALIAWIAGQDAAFYTAFTFSAGSGLFWFVLLAAAAMVPLLSHLTLRLFFRRRYHENRPYFTMIRENPRRRFGGGFRRLFLTLAVILTVLSACRGVLFFNDNFTVRTGFFPFSSETVSYERVDYVLLKERKSGDYYQIVLKDGSYLDLSSVMKGSDSQRVQKTMAPIFEEHKIPVRQNPPIVRELAALSDATGTVLSLSEEDSSSHVSRGR